MITQLQHRIPELLIRKLEWCSCSYSHGAVAISLYCCCYAADDGLSILKFIKSYSDIISNIYIKLS